LALTPDAVADLDLRNLVSHRTSSAASQPGLLTDVEIAELTLVRHDGADSPVPGHARTTRARQLVTAPAPADRCLYSPSHPPPSDPHALSDPPAHSPDEGAA
jgi:hypothetical protein